MLCNNDDGDDDDHDPDDDNFDDNDANENELFKSSCVGERKRKEKNSKQTKTEEFVLFCQVEQKNLKLCCFEIVSNPTGLDDSSDHRLKRKRYFLSYLSSWQSDRHKDT